MVHLPNGTVRQLGVCMAGLAPMLLQMLLRKLFAAHSVWAGGEAGSWKLIARADIMTCKSFQPHFYVSHGLSML